MLELKKVAVTGGISSGKSQVCQYFSKLKAYVVDADDIVHRLLTPTTELGKKVVQLLGSSIIVNGEIQRNKIAKKVFLNPKLLRCLEELIHPTVYEEINHQYQQINQKREEYTLFIAEIPLLFETQGERYFDYTIAVIADQEKCWERYRKKTGYEKEDFNRRMARQLSPHEKTEKANFVIYNNGTPEELSYEVRKIFDKLCNINNAF